MEQKKAELGNKLKPILKMLIYSRDCYLYAKYFGNLDSVEEIIYFQNSMELQFVRLMLWRSGILELSKLLSKKESQKYNLHNLLDQFKADQYYGDLGISKDLLDNWKSKIANNIEVIENLETLRDRVIAHTHDAKSYQSYEIELDQFKELLDICEDIFNTIRFVVFNKDYPIDSFFKNSEFNLVKILVLAHKNGLGGI